MTIEDLIESKDYKDVIRHFCELSKVPRGSGYNREISDWICAFAQKHGIEYEQDEALNVILRKKASVGYENAPSILLQGHMDMVCVKEEGCSHDFTKEGLELQSDGEWLYANKTTLGADNGVSIAYMLSLLTDPDLQHPDFICLITTDEETGMDGARVIKAEGIQANYLINIDSEEEGICCCGCAGGRRIEVKLPLLREEKQGRMVTIELGGLSGGHSGVDIHKCIPNAIHLCGRLLEQLSDACDYSLVSFHGGEKDNSIPVTACANLLAENPQKVLEEAKRISDTLIALYGKSQGNMRFLMNVEENDRITSVMQKETQEKLLFLLTQAPDGVQSMSRDIEGLVETSLNLGIFSTEDKYGIYHFSLRSSVAEELRYLSRKVIKLSQWVGGSCETGSDYPAWEYRTESKLRDYFFEVYEQLYGKKPETSVIHAGLECGLLREKLPDTDMISIGPNMYDIHTPKERLEINSMIRVYRILEQMLIQIRK